MTRLLSALVAAAALLAFVPAAQADSMILDPPPVIVRPWTPSPVIVRPWTPPPTTVVVRPWAPPPVWVRPWAPPPPPPPTAVVVRPVVVAPSAPPTVVVAEAPAPPVEPAPDGEGGTIDDRGPGVRAARRVVVGGGFGGLMFAGGGSGALSSSFGLHLGVALRQASIGLRVDMAPDAVEVADETGARSTASYTIGGLGFGYHFNAESLIHPVVGASLELHALDPSDADASYGFGVGARAGLEMEYPLDSGSLGIGLDVSGHRRFGSESAMPVPATALAFGGTIDYRF